ncbi:SMP-30/gluconolactonase/LRE family protein [Verrucomicrobiales bacterium]|nr:SMP-30/gluconolactonase/LRE family protein [Verrucomicrobiales bacterium]MDC0258601.1 SMP-30/gluconolactonase/LRE family protein [Verrucomicrobiales bacterium]
MMRKTILLVVVSVLFTAEPRMAAQDSVNFPTIGEVIRLDPEMDNLVPKDEKIEVLTSGFIWAEGPVWVPQKDHAFGGYVLFSDIPNNRIVRWDEGVGSVTWLKPSGYTGPGEYGGEPGSNGLLLDAKGRLVACEHGDRRMSVITKNGGKRTLVDNFEGKRLNSPNDACYHKNGDLYFTDPPYGLPDRWDDPRRELDFCGVYRLSKDGKLTLLTKEMTRPNGIAFSPDHKTLYVAQSDPEAALWKSFPVKEDGTLGEGKLLYDATENFKKGLPGLPDGLKVDSHGNIWATGPGGVYVFAPGGTLLGRISTGEKTANCGWGNDGRTLYITADMYLCRIRTTAMGAGWAK